MKNIFQPKKASKTEYTAAMLPHNRREVFFDVLKLHWRSFILYGFASVLITLPLFIITFLENAVTYNIIGNEEITEEVYAQIIALQNTAAFFRIPCLLIVAAFLAGFIKIIRQYAWEENVTFFHDFKTGFKSNARQMFLIWLLAGGIYALCVYAYNFSGMTENNATAVVILLPVLLSLVIGLPTFAYAIAACSVYNCKFGSTLYTSLLLTFTTLPRAVLAMLCCLTPFAAALIPNSYFMIFGWAASAFLFPVILLGWYLFALNQFDKKINQRLYPDLVGRGLVIENRDNDS